jgi:pilus assembly protein CpaF
MMSQGPKDPIFYNDKLGQRRYSLASLREKIEEQFAQESAGRADIMQELDTREKRLKEIREVADYVLSHEHVVLPPEDKRQLIEEAVANLFYFGALDAYIRDPQTTEITIEGPFDISLRHGFNEMEKLEESPFESLPHLERTLGTVLASSGGILMSDNPYLELGLRLHERPVRISVITPPVSPAYSVQMRLHPAEPLPLESLAFLPEGAAEMLRSILDGKRGLIVTGESGTGKTTLIAALLRGRSATVVERATEMALDEGMKRLVPPPPKFGDPAQDFGAQIREAGRPATLVLDEIRGDESAAFWEALTTPEIRQVIVAFRGTSNPARLHSALSMAIRKHHFSLESAPINVALLEKLPFVAALTRPKDRPPHLSLIGHWKLGTSGLILEPLLTWNGVGEPQYTDAK